MKGIFLALGIAIALSSAFAQAEEKPTDFVILDRDGKIATVDDIADYFINQGADVIFFGEKHDSRAAHCLELQLLKKIAARVPKLAVAMEMFEADNQDELDDYLAGKISEKQFKNSARLWPNYDTDYRPIIEFAKAKGIPVIAANIPRRYASMVARGGTKAWKSLPDSEKVYLPKKYTFLNDRYREEFLKTMQGNPMMKMMGKVNMDNLYHAQCVKDEKMAESVAEFLKSHPGYKVIFFNGSFHSDYKLGIAQKLKMRMPNIKIVNISTVPVPKDVKFDPEALKGELDRADFVIFTHESSEE